MKKKLTAKTMVELKSKIYENEGWKFVYGENRMMRCVESYDIMMLYEENKFIATKKSG